MTRLLEEAIKAVSNLPDDKQDAIAAAMLDELQAEARWEESFSSSTEALGSLADRVLAERRAGRTRPLTLDEL